MEMCKDVLTQCSLQYGELTNDDDISLSTATGLHYEIFSCLDGFIVIRKSPIVSRYKIFSEEEMILSKKTKIAEAEEILASQISKEDPNSLKFSINIPHIITGDPETIEGIMRAVNNTLNIWVEDGLSFEIDTELGVVLIDASSSDFTSNYLSALLDVFKKMKDSKL